MRGTDAFALVRAHPCEVAPAVAAVRDLDVVIAAYAVTGENDVIAQLDLGDPDVLTHDWLQTEIEADGRGDVVEDVAEELQAIGDVSSATVALAYQA